MWSVLDDRRSFGGIALRYGVTRQEITEGYLSLTEGYLSLLESVDYVLSLVAGSSTNRLIPFHLPICAGTNRGVGA
jgi:hypothetical protein